MKTGLVAVLLYAYLQETMLYDADIGTQPRED